MPKGIKKDPSALTTKQAAFVDAFLSEECMLDPIKAYDAAGYAHSYNKYSEAMKVLNSTTVVREINRRMAQLDTAFWINENIIIKKLWEEATNKDIGSSQAARINALVWIGKHIGMWQEKKVEEKDTRPVINITNYGIDEKAAQKELTKPEVVKEANKVSLPEGVVITQYDDTQH